MIILSALAAAIGFFGTFAMLDTTWIVELPLALFASFALERLTIMFVALLQTIVAAVRGDIPRR